MIQAATKYGSVRPAGAKAPAGQPASSVPTAAFNIIAGRAKAMKPADFMAWWNKELKSGGDLHAYCEREKAEAPKRYRAVARKMDGFKQNNKSEFKRVADIPARDYFRWLKEDPDFFHDDKNLKSLRRDNPDVKVYL